MQLIRYILSVAVLAAGVAQAMPANEAMTPTCFVRSAFTQTVVVKSRRRGANTKYHTRHVVFTTVSTSLTARMSKTLVAFVTTRVSKMPLAAVSELVVQKKQRVSITAQYGPRH